MTMGLSQASQTFPTKTWKKTFYTLWLGSFITGLGFSMTMPFMPLYMETLGHYSTAQLSFYSGLAFSATYLAQAIVSPYWGSLADRKGRKLMCLRASGVMTFTLFITGFAHHVWTIILLRFIQGSFSGYVNNSVAFIAGETPNNHSGTVLAEMQTASVSGNLLGPIFGGAIAGIWGYRVPFWLTGILMGICFILTLVGATEEHFKPVAKQKMESFNSIFKTIPHKGLIATMFMTTLFIQSSLMSISPIISLLVKQLMHNQGPISFVSGIVAAAPGFGTLLAARQMGHTMDRIGPLKVLTVGLIAEVLLFIPMFLVTSPWNLAGLRFLIGIGDAALMPAAQTVLTLVVPRKAFGRVFSYNQSFQAAGGVFGPMIGSGVAGLFNYQTVFLATALMLGVNFILVIFARYHQPQKQA